MGLKPTEGGYLLPKYSFIDHIIEQLLSADCDIKQLLDDINNHEKDIDFFISNLAGEMNRVPPSRAVKFCRAFDKKFRQPFSMGLLSCYFCSELLGEEDKAEIFEAFDSLSKREKKPVLFWLKKTKTLMFLEKGWRPGSETTHEEDT